MNKELIVAIEEDFQERFDAIPLIIFSPGRINLIGEHTDYNEGFAFPAAIDMGIGLAIQKSTDNVSFVFAKDMTEFLEIDTDDIQRIENGGWKNYVLGVVAELQKRNFVIGNFDATFSGDLPIGAGMSASAALENAFVLGLNQLFELGLSKDEMILIAQKAEHNYAGVQCGIMDQYASMFGVMNTALLLDCRTDKAKPYSIDFNEHQLLLINTNVKHDLADGAYNDRRKVCEAVSEKLNIQALRDATALDLERIKNELSESEYLKASFILEENSRVVEFAKAMEGSKVNILGNLLFESHQGLSEKYDVSCEELDFLVDSAKNEICISGARMMGGGFGGCTLNIIEKSSVGVFKKKIADSFMKKFGNSCSFYDVKLSEGTRIIAR